MHKELFYKYIVMYVRSTGRVVDEHPHFVHSSCSEQAFFYKSVLGGLNLHPIARGPKTLKARRPRRDRRTRGVSQKNAYSFALILPELTPASRPAQKMFHLHLF